MRVGLGVERLFCLLALCAGFAPAPVQAQAQTHTQKWKIISFCEKALEKYREGRALRELEKSFSPLVRNKDIKLRDNEITRPLGRLASKSDSLSDLVDGEYPFLIDSLGRIFFIDRTPDQGAKPLDPSKHLATHRTLELFFNANNPENAVIVSAGVFIRTNDRIREVSNQAGTFIKGNDQSRLDYSVRKLALEGLPIETMTIRRLAKRMETSVEAHVSESKQSELVAQYRNTGRYMEMASGYRMLSIYLPHPTIPGWVDEDAFRKLAYEIREDRLENRTERSFDDTLNLNQAAGTIPYLNEYGVAYSLHQLVKPQANVTPSEAAEVFLRTMAGMRLVLSKAPSLPGENVPTRDRP
jgi:hypothetical protein